MTQTVQCTHCHGTGRIEVSTGDLEKVARESIRMFPGKKIVAIKRVREIMGCSLVDAKNACDAAQRPVKPPKFSSQEEADQWMEEHLTDFKVGDLVRLSEKGKSYYTNGIRSTFGTARITKISASKMRASEIPPTCMLDLPAAAAVFTDCIELVPLPAPPPPKFASVEEAEAWMEAQAR